MIPNFALYGEGPLEQWSEMYHHERIALRSKHYDWKIQSHQHESLLQLLYIEEHTGVVYLDGVPVEFFAPCMILIPAQTIHGFDFQTGVEGSVITATQKSIESILQAPSLNLSDILQTPGVVNVPSSENIHKVLTNLFNLVEQETLAFIGTGSSSASAIIVALLIHYRRFGLSSTQASGDLNGSKKAEHIQRFRSLINNSIGQMKSVEEYASALGMSSGQLRRICQEVLEMSPLQIINSRLIHIAQRDLAYSSLSVQQIAYVLGFQDAAYFSRFFRKFTGLTPTMFREKVHEKSIHVGDAISGTELHE